MTATTLYLVTSGASTVDEPLGDLARLLSEDGWRITVISTPMGTRFHDSESLHDATGGPVRVDFRMPGTGVRLEPADVVVACPLSFNSTNKFANGIADNMAVATLCEMVGADVPTVVVPKVSPPLCDHPAFARSLAMLQAMPRVRVLWDRETRIPAWHDVRHAARAIIDA